MIIDIANFTPIPAFLGGLLIGLGVIIFFIATGRLAGVSGISYNVISNNNRFTNILFLIGLVIGPIVYKFLISENIPFLINKSYLIIISGGLLVGLGTKIGSGCTSGHGVCGVSRFSVRSILATILFIFSGIITVLIMQLYGLTL
mgnify:FL=1